LNKVSRLNGMVIVLVIGLLVWAGAALLIDAWHKRARRPDLTERLAPFQPRSVADEAQEWLGRS